MRYLSLAIEWNPDIIFLGVVEDHYNDVIMSTTASQITSLMIVYSIFYSCGDETSQLRVTGLCRIELDLFNNDTRPTEHISRPTQVGSLTVYNLWQFISDRRIRLLVKIPLCKSQESSQRRSSESQQCSIHTEFPAELHIPRACGQWSTSVQNDCK